MVMKSGVFQMAGLLPSDKASSVVYTTKKNEVDRKVTITWAVCTREVVEFEGEGLATNEATLFFPFKVFFLLQNLTFGLFQDIFTFLCLILEKFTRLTNE